MNETITDNIQDLVDNLNKGDKQTVEIPNLNGLNTEYAIENKWVGYFPLSNVLGKDYSNLELNLREFTIPQMVCGSTSVAFKGQTMEIPTKTFDQDTKEITITYVVDQKWQNYKSLFLFASQTGIINPPITQEAIDVSGLGNMIDCRIWLIDHFKNRIVDFIFHNCWIKVFGDLRLDYSSTNEVVHSFTLAYSNFELADANP